MKLSVGVDIEEVKRFPGLIRKKNFLTRVYTPLEIAYCRSKKNQSQHFAVRFAAKEAVWKAMSGFLPKGHTLSHKQIGLRNNQHGKPVVVISGPLAKLSGQLSVSLSHSKSSVVAVALFQRT